MSKTKITIKKINPALTRATQVIGLGGGVVQAEKVTGGKRGPTLGDASDASKLASGLNAKEAK